MRQNAPGFHGDGGTGVAGRLDGKVCVITGAGGGMGREAALVFTTEGARVCVADISAEAAAETVALCTVGSAFAFPVDVADQDGVKAMMAETAERFGGIDVLYNNASRLPTTARS
jgi:NAD(P)-dependent dehydrogenase (short-subunit alcohol dehydrogenase family)